MTQEDKQLLLQDFCVRLPYGVKFLRESWNYEWDQELSVIEVLEDIDKDGYINNTKVYRVEDIKLYLRPMSSMTEEERKEYHKTLFYSEAYDESNKINGKITFKTYDYLNSIHIDYRGLIPKGLAIAVTEENNPYKDNKV